VLVELEILDGQKKGVVELVLLQFHGGEMLLDRLLQVGHHSLLEGTDFVVILLVRLSIHIPIVIMSHFQILPNIL